jgi:hypothetical protein
MRPDYGYLNLSLSQRLSPLYKGLVLGSKDSSTESSFPNFNYPGAQMAQLERQQAYNLPGNVSPHPLFPLPRPDEVSSDIDILPTLRVLIYG